MVGSLVLQQGSKLTEVSLVFWLLLVDFAASRAVSPTFGRRTQACGQQGLVARRFVPCFLPISFQGVAQVPCLPQIPLELVAILLEHFVGLQFGIGYYVQFVGSRSRRYCGVAVIDF